MKFALALLLAISPAVLATDFQDCGSEATGITFEVEGCDVAPCVVSRGDTFSASIYFTADHDSETLTAAITASIGGFDVVWPGFDTDACNYVEPACPVLAGTPAVWTYPVEVLAEYPTISTVVTFRILEEEEDHDCVCLQVPVTVV